MSGDALSFKGVVISSQEYKDKDRLLSILTRNLGLITIMAKGVSKMNSKHAFLSMSFMLCDFTVTKSGNFYYLKEANIIENNSGISSNLESMTVAYHISELIKFSSFDNMPTDDLYELVNYAFYHLGRKPEHYKIVYSAFNWRFLYLLGLNKSFDYCDKCQEELENLDSLFFNMENNLIFCNSCVNLLQIDRLYRLNSVSIKALNYFIEADYSRIFNVNIDDKLLELLMSFTTAYASNALERNITTLQSLNNLLI